MREIERSCPVHSIPPLQKTSMRSAATVLAGTNAGAGETKENSKQVKNPCVGLKLCYVHPAR